MDASIKQILHKPNLVGCMVAWVVELFEFGILYEKRKAIKAYALVDFAVEMTRLKT